MDQQTDPNHQDQYQLPKRPGRPAKHNPTNLELAKALGIPIRYARFHQPVPPALNLEPVAEFKVIKSEKPIERNKYSVDAMLKTPIGIVWSAYGETDSIIELANVMYVRT